MEFFSLIGQWSCMEWCLGMGQWPRMGHWLRAGHRPKMEHEPQLRLGVQWGYRPQVEFFISKWGNGPAWNGVLEWANGHKWDSEKRMSRSRVVPHSEYYIFVWLWKVTHVFEAIQNSEYFLCFFKFTNPAEKRVLDVWSDFPQQVEFHGSCTLIDLTWPTQHYLANPLKFTIT